MGHIQPHAADPSLNDVKFSPWCERQMIIEGKFQYFQEQSSGKIIKFLNNISQIALSINILEHLVHAHLCVQLILYAICKPVFVLKEEFLQTMSQGRNSLLLILCFSQYFHYLIAPIPKNTQEKKICKMPIYYVSL